MEPNYRDMPVKDGIITDADEAFAESIVARWPDTFRGGSYIVHGRDAGDIDVVIPHRLWPEIRAALAGQVMKVQKEFPTEEEDITEEDRLVCVYRRGNVDLLVIRDAYVESYANAVRDMRDRPEDFLTREARVRVHVYYADELRREHGWPLEEDIVRKRRHRFKAWGGTGEYEG